MLKQLKRSKHKGTTGRVHQSPQLLAEEKLTFQRIISMAFLEHDTPAPFVVNLDQTPLSYVSPGKNAFIGAKNVPTKGVDDKTDHCNFFLS